MRNMFSGKHPCTQILLLLGTSFVAFTSTASAAVDVNKHGLQGCNLVAPRDMGHIAFSHGRIVPAFGFTPSLALTPMKPSTCVQGKALAPVRARHQVRNRPCGGLMAQLPNPFQSLFGTETAKDRQYHESRLRHHEERIKYHEERARYHRANLQSIARDVSSGVFEEKIARKAEQEGRPVRILFVDLSNTCRSPAAEAIMTNMIKSERLPLAVEVSSCSTGSGTRDWFKDDVAADIEVESSDPRMVSHASRRGLNLAGRRSKAMKREDVINADLLVAMDVGNKKDIVQAASYWGLKGEAEGKVRLLANYCRSGTRTTEVPDPYYGGKGGQASGQVFEKVLDLLEDGCRGLLSDLAPARARS